METLDVLREELPSEGFDGLAALIAGFQGPPFLYSRKRKEFLPSDEWFALTGDGDGDGSIEADPDDIMELAFGCVGILNKRVADIDTTGIWEVEPSPTRHVLTYGIGNADLARKVVKALTEAGYGDVTVKRAGDGFELEVPFTASTDWEYAREGSALKSTIEMMVRCCEGKGTMAVRL